MDHSNRIQGTTEPGSAVVLVALLLTATLVKTWALAQSAEGLDYYQFWVVGRALAAGTAGDIYRDETRARLGRDYLLAAQAPGAGLRQRAAAQERAVLQTYATPLLYVAIGALTTGDYDADYRAFQLLSVAAALGGILLLGRLVGFPWLGALATAVVFLDWFEPFLSDVRVGNVNRIQLGWVALFLWLRGRGRWGAGVLAGLSLALAVLFKPNLAWTVPLFGVSWLRRRRFHDLRRVGTGLVAGALVGLGGSSLAFGSTGCWPRWMAAAAHIPDETTPVGSGNFALARLVADAWGFHATPLLAAAVALTTVLVLVQGRSFGAGEGSDTIEDARVLALGCLVWLLSAPLVWAHYLLLAVPAAVLTLRPAPARPVRRWLGAGAVAALMLNPLRAVGVARGPWQMAEVSVLGLAVLWIVLLRDPSEPAGWGGRGSPN